MGQWPNTPRGCHPTGSSVFAKMLRFKSIPAAASFLYHSLPDWRIAAEIAMASTCFYCILSIHLPASEWSKVWKCHGITFETNYQSRNFRTFACGGCIDFDAKAPLTARPRQPAIHMKLSFLSCGSVKQGWSSLLPLKWIKFPVTISSFCRSFG